MANNDPFHSSGAVKNTKSSIKEGLLNKTFIGGISFLSFFTLSFFATNSLITPDGDSSAAPLLQDTAPSMSVVAPNHISFNLAANSTLVNSIADFTINTNNPNGYSIAVSTPAVDNCLKHASEAANSCENISENKKIQPYDTIDSNLWANTWGIQIGSSYYGVLPEMRKVGDYSQATINHSITFGAKADTSMIAGVYSGNLTFTVEPAGIMSPVIAGVVDESGWAGDKITIYGQGLQTAYSVKIGGEDCINADILSDFAIACQVPILSSGTKDIEIMTWGGTATLLASFEYGDTSVAPPPRDLGIPPAPGLVHPRVGDIIIVSRPTIYFNIPDNFWEQFKECNFVDCPNLYTYVFNSTYWTKMPNNGYYQYPYISVTRESDPSSYWKYCGIAIQSRDGNYSRSLYNATNTNDSYSNCTNFHTNPTLVNSIAVKNNPTSWTISSGDNAAAYIINQVNYNNPFYQYIWLDSSDLVQSLAM
jgi:hypothetical protein